MRGASDDPARPRTLDQHPATAAADDRWRQLARLTGAAGLLAPVLILGPISAASGQEPGFTGTAAQVRTFFLSTSGPGPAFGSALATVGLVAVLWFAVGLGPAARASGGGSGLAVRDRRRLGVNVRDPQPRRRLGGRVVPSRRPQRRAGALRLRRGQPDLRQQLGGHGQLRPLRGLGRLCAPGARPAGRAGSPWVPAWAWCWSGSAGAASSGSPRTPCSGCGSSPCPFTCCARLAEP